MKRFILTTVCISLFLCSFAQKVQKICGEYTYYAPSNISLDEAKKIAIERAKLTALAEEFGTLISQSNITVVENETGKSNIDFKSLSQSEVKGEWIEDTKEPEAIPSYEQGMLIIHAKVCGKAREITKAAINFTATVLRNGKDNKFESATFKEGDDLYLRFQSPVKGYLAVYLVDEDQVAFCLLPYAKDSRGQTEIEHGQSYLFFDAESVSVNEKQTVDELTVTCERIVEHNQLYIIFSPNPFIKANDHQKSEGLPRELAFSDFISWLSKNRNIDKDMQVEIKHIQIHKK